MNEVGLSYGANLGDRLERLGEGRRRLLKESRIEEVARSPVYETEPVDVREAYRDLPYLNAVQIVSTDLSPEALNRTIHEIEEEMGRTRSDDRNAPRPIDIDIIYVDGLRIERNRLSVPHPKWAERRFVVAPLADVRPGLVLPGRERTVAELLERLPARPRAVRFAETW